MTDIPKAITVHATCLAFLLFVFWYETQHVHRNGESFWEFSGFGGKLKYLTFISLIFSVIFMGLTLINDLVLWRRSTSDFPKCNSAHLKYYEFVSYMETSVTFPLALQVFTLYWGLQLVYGGNVINGGSLGNLIPHWLNHAEHTIPAPLFLLNKILFFYKYPSRKVGLGTVAGIGIVYGLWMIYLVTVKNILVYPVLAKFTLFQMCLFILACCLVGFVIYFIGELVTYIAWGSTTNPKRPVTDVGRKDHTE